MKKKLVFAVLLLLNGASAQFTSPILVPILEPQPQYSASFNGTTQYLSKSSPVSMDLNGSETLINTTFDTNVNGYSVSASSTFAQITNANRVHSGAGAGAWKTTTPASKSLTSTTWTPSTAGVTKWTLEAWVFFPSTDSVTSGAISWSLMDTTGTVALTNSATTNPGKNTWTKVVFNTQDPASNTTGGVSWRLLWRSPIGVNDSVIVDDVSLTQAYDAMSIYAIRLINIGAVNTIVDNACTGSTNNRLLDFVATGGSHYRHLFTDSSGVAISDSSSTLLLNQWQLVACTIQRNGNVTSYLNGISTGSTSATTLGRITKQSPSVVNIGANRGGSGTLNGFLAPLQFVRFNSLPFNIATVIAAMSNSWRTDGLKGGYNLGGTVVLDTDMQSLRDNSNTQGVLTNVGGTPYGIPVQQ